jgi:isopenicillin N synthase-like dioxygenase
MTLGISDPSKGIYACGAHSDFGMMTLLATDGVMGLQVLSSSDLLIYIRFDMTGLVM